MCQKKSPKHSGQRDTPEMGPVNLQHVHVPVI